MRIPTSFPILGQTITVHTIPPEDWEYGEECVGCYESEWNTIAIRGDYTGTKREQIFFHELVHACLDSLSSKLNHNEKFVDQLAGVLHQAFSKAKYKRA